jgi:hypothetical protein
MPAERLSEDDALVKLGRQLATDLHEIEGWGAYDKLQRVLAESRYVRLVERSLSTTEPGRPDARWEIVLRRGARAIRVAAESGAREWRVDPYQWN